VVIVTEAFSKLASTISRSEGKPELPILVLPANVEELPEEELRSLARATLDEAAQKLTLTKSAPTPPMDRAVG
jgi:hypothetical protein